MKLPDTLTEIGECAFSGCSVIKELTIPESVKTINAYAFFEWEDDQMIYVKGKAKTSDSWYDDWKSEG